jgi:hypothetical protein
MGGGLPRSLDYYLLSVVTIVVLVGEIYSRSDLSTVSYVHSYQVRNTLLRMTARFDCMIARLNTKTQQSKIIWTLLYWTYGSPPMTSMDAFAS